VRPTLRCLVDLKLELPGAASRLDDIQHPVLEKASELASAHPANQVRIQAIEDTMVYRFTHGRHRVLTWLDQETNIVWICGVDLRREDEGYDSAVALHASRGLLPGQADRRRLEDEAIFELGSAIREHAPEWVADTRANPNTERQFVLPGGATIRLYYEPGDEVHALWTAFPTLRAEELGLPATVRALAMAAVSEALGGANTEFEQRYDWPTGQPLQNFEVAFFWLH